MESFLSFSVTLKMLPFNSSQWLEVAFPIFESPWRLSHLLLLSSYLSLPYSPVVKNLPASAGDKEFDPWVGKIPWRRKWQPNLVFFFFLVLYIICGCAGSSSWAFSSCGACASPCAGFSVLQSVGSRRAGSGVVVHRRSCSKASGVFQDQGSNPCPLHWQADS